MKKIPYFAGALTLILSATWPAMGFAGHPLLTEDTGTQGAGNFQLELTHDHGDTNISGLKVHEQSFNTVLSIGLKDNLDAIISLPYERISERGLSDSTVMGFADVEIAAKWRFYEGGPLSIALRPGLGLPTGNEDKGLSAGHLAPSLFAVTTYAIDPWAFHLHLGYGHNIFDGTEQRTHIYHASVAAEYFVSESLRFVGDASVESNPDLSGDTSVGSVVLGMVYAVVPDLDIDLGYRKGLTDPAPDHTWQAGLALRF